MGHEFTVDLALSYATGDEQAVLGAKINNNDGFPLGTRNSFAGWRWLLSTQLLGDLQIGGDLNVATGGNAMAVAWLFF